MTINIYKMIARIQSVETSGAPMSTMQGIEAHDDRVELVGLIDAILMLDRFNGVGDLKYMIANDVADLLGDYP